MEAFDVVIIGGDMVGLALALGLNGCGMRIAIIEHVPQQHICDLQKAQILKISAINTASQALLEYLGVWKTIIQKKVGCYQCMEIWQKNSLSYIRFDATEHHLTALGHTIDNAIICESLWQQVKLSKDIAFLRKHKLKKIFWGEHEVFITVDNEQMLTARLIVSADGSKSWLREQADIPISFWDYEHMELVAIIRSDTPHMQTAYQAFHSNGMLACFPLHDPHHYSIFWSLPTMQARRYLDLEVSNFEKELSVALDMRLGFCQLISKRQIFHLIGQYAKNFASQRIVLIGDSARTLHHLAGQEVNLGLMDVAELMGQIRYLNTEGKDIGQYFYLQSYERKRKYHTILVVASIQRLKQLFYGEHPMKKIVGDIGLRLTNIVPGIKEKLLHYALGSNDMPEWLVKITANSSEII
ncbi:MAG: FAD-dependent monooxygenase [Candidatus Arsenophonus melophagi]|nr:FAD-dependent monooxygenase [Candidatus Arsenophonus melophagi]